MSSYYEPTPGFVNNLIDFIDCRLSIGISALNRYSGFCPCGCITAGFAEKDQGHFLAVFTPCC